MLNQVKKIPLSCHSYLYDLLIKEDDVLRTIQNMVDWDEIHKILAPTYSKDFGARAKDPVMMFKYVLLKCLYPMSDRDLVERSMTDLRFKYFLELMPEDNVIDPSTLTVFRREHLKDTSVLDAVLKHSVGLAIKKGVIKPESEIIIDSTHVLSRYNLYSAEEFLRKYTNMLLARTASLENQLYAPSLLPARPVDGTGLEAWVGYANDLVDFFCQFGLDQDPKIGYPLRLLAEGISDMDSRSRIGHDPDARSGFKSQAKPFDGYKAHVAMTPERIITGAVASSGEKADGAFLPALVEQSVNNGLEKVTGVAADSAYSGLDNIKYCGDDIELSAPLNPCITNGVRSKETALEFVFNKDADTCQCPGGHLAVSKSTQKAVAKQVGPDGKVIRKHKNERKVFHFDIKKCRNCPLKDKCLSHPEAKKKTWSITILPDISIRHQELQKTERYRRRQKSRFAIEAQNNHLKNDMGLKKCISRGIESMEMQMVVAIFTANVTRIITLMGQKG